MGFYLSKPITEKETIIGDCSKFNYVLSGMQGSHFFSHFNIKIFVFSKNKNNLTFLHL